MTENTTNKIIHPDDLRSILLERPLAARSGWRVDWQPLELGDLIGLEAPTFETSGTSSGEPVAWTRTWDQLLAEAQVTIDCLPTGIDQVVTTVAPTTLYGYVFGVLVPAVLGVPSEHRRLLLRKPRFDPGHTLVATIAPQWRSGPGFDVLRPGERLTFAHAGSRIPTSAFDLVAREPRARVLEFFGATECGLVGVRKGSRDPIAPWRLVDDVTLLPGAVLPSGETQLRVASPRVGDVKGRPRVGEVTTSDFIRHLGKTEFVFNGRRERLCKPDGIRVDLDILEDQIRTIAPGVIDLACMPVDDPLKGEAIELWIVGKPDLVPQVEAMIRSKRTQLAYRPRVVAVESIERSEMGKVRKLRKAS